MSSSCFWIILELSCKTYLARYASIRFKNRCKGARRSTSVLSELCVMWSTKRNSLNLFLQASYNYLECFHGIILSFLPCNKKTGLLTRSIYLKLLKLLRTIKLRKIVRRSRARAFTQVKGVISTKQRFGR